MVLVSTVVLFPLYTHHVVVMSGSVGHQFSIVYTAVHKAVVVVIPPTDCTISIKFQKIMQWKTVCIS